MPQALASALSPVTRFCAQKPLHPIGSHVLLEATAQGLWVTAANDRGRASRLVAADIQEEGSTTVPAKLLQEFVQSMPPRELNAELNPEKEMLTVTCGRNQSRLKGLSAVSFPAAFQIEGPTACVHVDQFLHAVEQTTVAAGQDEARPQLAGVLFEFAQGSVTMAATDGHRLAVRSLRLTDRKLDLGVKPLVPAKLLQEAVRLFKNETGEICLQVGRSTLQLSCGGSVMSIRLIEGTFPEYRKVIPQEKPKTVVSAELPELLSTLRSVSVFARELTHVVRFKVAGDGMQVHASSPEIGHSQGMVRATVVGDETEAAFNGRYLMDALAAFGDGSVEFRLNGSAGPACLAVGGLDDYLYVMMPVRLAA